VSSSHSEIGFKTIATYHCALKGKFGAPRQSGLVPELQGKIHFSDQYKRLEALRGLEDFDYLWLIWSFSENRDNCFHPTVRPPRLGGNTRLGVFATRSPYRPNPIGLSSVRLESIDFENCILHVSGADLIDGTPILDIKPYLPYSDSHPDAHAGFTDSSQWQSLEVVFSDELKKGFTPSEVEALIKILSLDPRPKYQDDPERIYALTFSGRNIRFRVDSCGTVTVIQV